MARQVFRGVVIGLFVLVVVAALGARAGWVTVPWPRSQGPGFWQVSRALGFTAYAALALEVLLGLFLSTGLADGWIARARSGEVHRWLSPVALALGGAHAVALLGDGFIRFDVLDLAVPFVAPYRPAAVALGILGLYCAIVVHASFALRSRLGPRAWRALHYLSFAAFAGATAHGLLAGTDSATPWGRAVYAVPTALVLWLVFYRAVSALGAGLGGAAALARRGDAPAGE